MLPAGDPFDEKWTHYSLKDTDWLIFFIITVSAFSFSQSAAGFVVTPRAGSCVCFMVFVFCILIGNIILRLWNSDQHNLPKINGETPPSGCDKDPPPLSWGDLWDVLVFSGQANILNGDFFFDSFNQFPAP